MNLRLVISDVDGTLVDKQKRLTDGTIAAVGRLRDAGVLFTLISARPPSGLQPLVAPLGLDEQVAAFNGGTLFRADGTVTERHVVPEEVVRGMFDLAEGSGADPWIFAAGRWHARVLEGTHVEHERLASAQEPILTPDMAALYGDVDKLTWVSDDEPMLRDLTARAQARFGDAATIGQSQTYYLDVTHARANKGDGVATLARALGIDLADVAVIGDQYNDLPMFARAGLAIAMGQAPDPVKAKAAQVTTANDEDGVAHAIDTILLPMVAGEWSRPPFVLSVVEGRAPSAPPRSRASTTLSTNGVDDVKKLIAFDLDGTLALSKQPLDEEMAGLLARLTQVAMVDIISGGDWPQFEKQVVAKLPPETVRENFVIQPTTGTKLYRFQDGDWRQVYAELFSDEEGRRIRDALKQAVEQAGYAHEQTWGEQIEDRGSQVTFSALGQQAPLEAKDTWDPDHAKRKTLKALLEPMLPGLSINMGGSTSIDITREGVDKAYGLRKLAETIGIGLDDILFLGDAIFPGGNDYPAFTLGLDVVKVRDVAETKAVVAGITSALK